MKEKIIDKMITIAKSPEFSNMTNLGDTISFRYKDGVIISNSNILFSDLTQEDFTIVTKGDKMSDIEALHMAVSGYKKDSNAIILSQGPYCKMVSKYCKKLPALLDDFAQIVGYTARVAKSKGIIDVLKALNSRNAAIIKDFGALALGRTLEEALTGVLVLEKGAKVFVDSSIISRPNKIGRIESLLMNIIYKKKYSKENQEVLMQDLDNNN